MPFKSEEFSFIILCTEPNAILLKSTVKSLKLGYPNDFIAVIPNSFKANVVSEMKAICPIFRSKGTFTSMLNTGMRNAPSNWGIFTMAGTWIRRNLPVKYSRFATSDTDVLFPIVDRISNFKYATLNGLCINKKTFKKVGPFQEQGKIEQCKERWSLIATALCKTKFKAILGAAIL